jgi:hypothetical protein
VRAYGDMATHLLAASVAENSGGDGDGSSHIGGNQMIFNNDVLLHHTTNACIAGSIESSRCGSSDSSKTSSRACDDSHMKQHCVLVLTQLRTKYVRSK